MQCRLMVVTRGVNLTEGNAHVCCRNHTRRPHKHCRKVSKTRTGLPPGITPHNSTNRSLIESKACTAVRHRYHRHPYRHQPGGPRGSCHTHPRHPYTRCLHSRREDAQEASGGRLASGLTSAPNVEVETHRVPLRCMLSSGRMTDHATRTSRGRDKPQLQVMHSRCKLTH